MSNLKLGIVTPVLTLLPRAHATWEETGTFADVVAIVQEAERLGYHHCTCSRARRRSPSTSRRRAAAGTGTRSRRSARSSVHTSTIRFATHVLVLGYHHPLAIAKRYGTLDEITGGRVILGVGVGSLREEFDLLGAPFDDRGDRADDAMRALRASLSQREPEYHGAYYDFGGFVDRPARAASARTDLGRRPHRALVAARGRARRRLGTVRSAHRRARRDARTRARDTDAWNARTAADRRVAAERATRSIRSGNPTASRSSWRSSLRSARPACKSASCTTPPRTTASSSPPSRRPFAT